MCSSSEWAELQGGLLIPFASVKGSIQTRVHQLGKEKQMWFGEGTMESDSRQNWFLEIHNGHLQAGYLTWKNGQSDSVPIRYWLAWRTIPLYEHPVRSPLHRHFSNSSPSMIRWTLHRQLGDHRWYDESFTDNSVTTGTIRGLQTSRIQDPTIEDVRGTAP